MSGVAIIAYDDLEIHKLHSLVSAARRRLAGLEAAYTIEKAKVDALQATLFKRLRVHCQERDRLRLVVAYRKQFLEAFLRRDESDLEKVSQEFRNAQSRSDQEYEETASIFLTKKELTAEEEAELGKLWKKLVKLYHPDRFSHEPDKLETYSKLTAAINRAKDTGDLETLRQIASDPHAFILRQGWTSLDFREEEEVARLQKLWESLEREIAGVLEATVQLHNSAEFELYELTAKSTEMLDSVVTKQIKGLEAEMVGLQNEANQLAAKIEQLTGKAVPNGEFA
jgi:DNA polymerase-3 subunit epsilon